MKPKTEQVVRGWETRHASMFPKEFRNKFLVMHSQGMSVKEIARKIKMHPQTLREWTIRERIPIHLFITKERRMLENNKNDIIKMYNKRASMYDIAKKYKLSVQTIKRFLQLNGIKRRTVSQANLNNPKIKGVPKDLSFQRNAVIECHKKLKIKNVATAGLGIGYIPDLVASESGHFIAIELLSDLRPTIIQRKIRASYNMGYKFILFKNIVKGQYLLYDCSKKLFANKIPEKYKW